MQAFLIHRLFYVHNDSVVVVLVLNSKNANLKLNSLDINYSYLAQHAW